MAGPFFHSLKGKNETLIKGKALLHARTTALLPIRTPHCPRRHRTPHYRDLHRRLHRRRHHLSPHFLRENTTASASPPSSSTRVRQGLHWSPFTASKSRLLETAVNGSSRRWRPRQRPLAPHPLPHEERYAETAQLVTAVPATMIGSATITRPRFSVHGSEPPAALFIYGLWLDLADWGKWNRDIWHWNGGHGMGFCFSGSLVFYFGLFVQIWDEDGDGYAW